MAEYKHGDMDIADHEQTFSGFVTFVARTVMVIAVILVLLAMIGG